MPTPEKHPLEPFLPAGARLLMLGSFPPPRARWSMEFYYPNLQNDMWRIVGYLFYGDREKFLVAGQKRFDRDALVKFCTEKGIALSDTAREVVRLKDNASDQFLQITSPLDLGAMLGALPECRAIAATGQKAVDTLLSLIDCAEPQVGGSADFVWQGRQMKLYRMPSSSRAYPKPLEEKAASYRKMFEELGML